MQVTRRQTGSSESTGSGDRDGEHLALIGPEDLPPGDYR